MRELPAFVGPFIDRYGNRVGFAFVPVVAGNADMHLGPRGMQILTVAAQIILGPLAFHVANDDHENLTRRD